MNRIVRLLCESSNNSTAVSDSFTSARPFWWRGSSVEFQLALSANGSFLTADDIGTLILEIKAVSASETDANLIRLTFGSEDCDAAFTADDWTAGTGALVSAVVPYDDAALAPGQYRIIVRHEALDGSRDTYLRATVEVVDDQSESPSIATPPTPAVEYFTKEESDVRYKPAGEDPLPSSAFVQVSDYGAIGNDSADDTAALQAAFAAAKSAKAGLSFGPGKIYRHTAALVIDWDCTVEGNYATLKPQTASQVGLMLGDSATGPYMIEVNNLNIEGTGAANGQILIDTPVTGTKMVTMRNCKVWFGGTGMRCNLMDYLRVERCWFKGSLTNVDLANDVRSAVFTGGGFGDASGNPVTPTTQTHVLCQEVYGVTFIGVEWGDGVTGIKVQNATNKSNQFVTLLGCRMERVRGNFIIPSDDTTGGKASPTNFLVEQCEFMGYGTAWTNNAAIHIPGGGGPFVFRNCTVSQSAASQFMIYAQSSTAFVMIENCVMGGSSSTVYKNSAGTTSSAARIVEGKNDATIKIPSPFGATHRLGTITATTAGINLGQLPRSCKILGMYITVKTALVSSATDYWTFALKTFSNGAGETELISYSQQNTAVPAYGRRGTTTITGSAYRDTGDYVYVLDITKNGSAANLDDLAVIIVYEQF